MEVRLNFNYPPREDKVTVRFGDANIADLECEFRVGLIRSNEPPTNVHWSLLDWVRGSDPGTLADLELEAEKGDVIRVEKRTKGGVVSYFDIDTESNWPAEALGEDAVETGWSFEE